MQKDFDIDFYIHNMEESPFSFWKALSSPNAIFQKGNINDEMESLIFNKTWKLVDLPPGCKIIRYKWVLKKKFKLNGTIDKYKVKLVTKGFK